MHAIHRYIDTFRADNIEKCQSCKSFICVSSVFRMRKYVLPPMSKYIYADVCNTSCGRSVSVNYKAWFKAFALAVLLCLALATLHRYPPVHIYRFFFFYTNPVAPAGSVDLLYSVAVNYAENPFGHSQHRINWIIWFSFGITGKLISSRVERFAFELCATTSFSRISLAKKPGFAPENQHFKSPEHQFLLSHAVVISADYPKPTASIAVGTKQKSPTQSAQLAIASAYMLMPKSLRQTMPLIQQHY